MAEQDTGPEKDPKPLKKNRKSPSIDTDPMMDKMESVNEGTGIPTSQADYLIRLGLGNRDQITFYRKAIQDPLGAVKVPQYRDYVGKVAHELLSMIWNDNQMLNRLRTLLQEKKGLSEAAMRSLTRKANEKDVSMDTVLEVYFRGIEQSGDPEIAFNRVNSFLSGGRAAELDGDLTKPKLSYDRIKGILGKKV